MPEETDSIDDDFSAQLQALVIEAEQSVQATSAKRSLVWQIRLGIVKERTGS